MALHTPMIRSERPAQSCPQRMQKNIRRPIKRGPIPSHGSLASKTAPSGAFPPRGRSSAMRESTQVAFRTYVEDRQLNQNSCDSQRFDANPDRALRRGSQRGERMGRWRLEGKEGKGRGRVRKRPGPMLTRATVRIGYVPLRGSTVP
jgi:hypothetical protein